MSDVQQIDDDEFDLVPVPMSPETREKLKVFAAKVGERPIMAAAMLLEDLLDDQDFWDAVDKNHLHRKAFRAAVAEDRMEAEKLAEYYEQLDYYRDVLGLTDRAKNAPALPMGEADEGEDTDGKVTKFPAPASAAAE